MNYYTYVRSEKYSLVNIKMCNLVIDYSIIRNINCTTDSIIIVIDSIIIIKDSAINSISVSIIITN